MQISCLNMMQRRASTCHEAQSISTCEVSAMDCADDDGREIDEHYKEGIARLQDFISTNEYSNNVCLVCLEQIAPHAAVWTCREACFCMLHLTCAQGWANQQLRAAAAKASSQAANP